MDKQPWSLSEREEAARGCLEQALKEHLELTLDTFNLAGAVMNTMPPRPVTCVPQSLKVTNVLLVKLSNDLRASALLAVRGYPVQALAVVASMYETAYTIAFIGSDENLAQQWIGHSDPTRPFQAVKTLTREGLKRLGCPDCEVERQSKVEYCVYSQLCMAKHGNPLFQKQHGYTLQGGDVTVQNGPSACEESIRGSWFALEHAAALALVGMASHVGEHLSGAGVPRETVEQLAARIREIGARRKRLEAKAQSRWGTTDPFPGRWSP
jgi:hypothetical protein